MKTNNLFVMMLVVATFVSCNKENTTGPNQPKPIDLPAKANDVIASSNSFGINLFKATAMVDEKNLMLSPISASTALTMLLNGCGTNTYAQIRDMLSYGGLSPEEINSAYRSLVAQLLSADPEVALALANAVFYREDFPFRQSYLEIMNTSFDADVTGLDFFAPSALNAINGWASDNTNGKITKVLEEINPLSVMFLMNALYFKGTWTYQFKPENTGEGTFYLKDGTGITVDMMHEKMPVNAIYGTNYQAIELNYGDGNFSMVIILPNATLNEYIAGFGPDNWEDIITGIDAVEEQEEKDIYLPKFRFEYEKELNDQLKELGMTDAFSEDYADLSGICDQEYLFVQFVKQNSFIEVNEQGTEAAAVTTIGIGYTSINEFIANKPFIFAIRERTTNTLLFIGKVEKPEY